MLIVFDDLIAHMISDKKLNSTVTKLFIRANKVSISLILIMQSYFKVPIDWPLKSDCSSLIYHQMIFYVLEKIF